MLTENAIRAEINKLQRRLTRIGERDENYDRYYAAMQALSWAINKDVAMAPYKYVGSTETLFQMKGTD